MEFRRFCESFSVENRDKMLDICVLWDELIRTGIMVNNVCYDMLESQVKKLLNDYMLNGSKINVTGSVKWWKTSIWMSYVWNLLELEIWCLYDVMRSINLWSKLAFVLRVNRYIIVMFGSLKKVTNWDFRLTIDKNC